MDSWGLQTLQDTIRVVMVLGVFYYIGVICMLLYCLLNWLCNLAVKGCKAIWRFIKKISNRPEALVSTAEKDKEM
ncbi:MAG: hypothetical protein VB018_13520 [Lachnospiraceae bacterium]|nr:hypothetical protein [Lachnospiraceae bacterium]